MPSGKSICECLNSKKSIEQKMRKKLTDLQFVRRNLSDVCGEIIFCAPIIFNEFKNKSFMASDMP
jgi:hypothetical protein